VTSELLDGPCKVRLALPRDRLPVQRMLELYQHDLSDIWDQDLDAHGEYGYSLDRFWSNSNECHAYVATVADRYAGFALVDKAAKVGADAYWMDQFFVLKKYRGRGIGRHLALAVLAALPGQWEIGQMPENHGAQAFWRSVVAACTSGAFEEQIVSVGGWQGVVQCFRVSGPRDV
jgi:predicted acetyltransferase